MGSPMPRELELAIALDGLSGAYVAWLLNEPDPRSADRIPERALASFEKSGDAAAALKTNGRVGLWLLSHSEGRPERLHLAGIAFERVLEVAHDPHAAEARASALANLATVLLLRKDGSEDRHRACRFMHRRGVEDSPILAADTRAR
jgi:hypothetical protein